MISIKSMCLTRLGLNLMYILAEQVYKSVLISKSIKTMCLSRLGINLMYILAEQVYKSVLISESIKTMISTAFYPQKQVDEN